MFYYQSQRDDREVRVFNVLDDHNREAIAVRAERSFPADRVVEVLEQLSRDRGLPKRIRVDNGPEFISQVFTQWCAAKGVEVHHIQPGKPAQNAYIERFNRTFREDVLTPTSLMILSNCSLWLNNGHTTTITTIHIQPWEEYHRSNTHQSPNLALS